MINTKYFEKMEARLNDNIRLSAENSRLKKLQLSDRTCIRELHEKIEVLEARLKRIIR